MHMRRRERLLWVVSSLSLSYQLNGRFPGNTVEKLFQRLKARSYLRFKRLSLL